MIKPKTLVSMYIGRYGINSVLRTVTLLQFMVTGLKSMTVQVTVKYGFHSLVLLQKSTQTMMLTSRHGMHQLVSTEELFLV